MTIIIAILQAILLVAIARFFPASPARFVRRCTPVRARACCRTTTTWRSCGAARGEGGRKQHCLPPCAADILGLVHPARCGSSACDSGVPGAYSRRHHHHSVPHGPSALHVRPGLHRLGRFLHGHRRVRELLVGVLVEPSLILVLFVMAVAAGSTNVGLMASSVANLTACPSWPSSWPAWPAPWPATSRRESTPFDLAEAEQEIQEGPLAAYSGPSLAMMKLGVSLKQLVVASLFVAIFLPFGAAATASPLDLLGGLVAYACKVLAVFLVASVIENAETQVSRPLHLVRRGDCLAVPRVPRHWNLGGEYVRLPISQCARRLPHHHLDDGGARPHRTGGGLLVLAAVPGARWRARFARRRHGLDRAVHLVGHGLRHEGGARARHPAVHAEEDWRRRRGGPSAS